MAITKIQSESLNLADDFAFTGTITGAGGNNKPYFQARLSGTQDLSDNVSTKVDFNNEILDSDNYYDTTNKRFTPLVAGKYLISLQLFISSNTASGLISGVAKILKNGSEEIRGDSYFASNYIDSAFFMTEKIINFNGSTDYVEAYAQIDTLTPPSAYPKIFSSNNRCLFQGYKIIE